MQHTSMQVKKENAVHRKSQVALSQDDNCNMLPHFQSKIDF